MSNGLFMPKDLTAAEVRALTKRGFYRVAPMLYLIIQPPNGRSWAFRYTQAGRTKWRGLGPTALVSLSEAKVKAHRMRMDLYEGRDPSRTTIESDGTTFAEMSAAYIAAHQSGWRAPKAVQTWTNSLATHAKGLADQKVSAITPGDVAAAIRSVWRASPSTAKKVRGRIERVLDYARAMGHREGPNPAAWKGSLSHLLPSLDGRPVKHHAATPVPDIPAFTAELAMRNSTSAKALMFTLLTAVRTGDTIGATWAEIDLDAKTWTMAAGRTKAGRPFRIPLSKHALKLLTGLPRNGDYVFKGKQGKPLSNMAMLVMMRGMRGKGETVHGLRSSFKDWATESGYADEVSEAALDHRGAGGKVRAAYARSDLFEQRRELMDKWAEYAMGAPRIAAPRQAPPSEAALEVHKSLSQALLGTVRQSG